MNRYILKKIDLVTEDEFVCLESHCRNIATMILIKENNKKTKEIGAFCNFHSSINQEYYEWKEHFLWMNLFIWIPVLWAIIYFPTMAIGKSKISKSKQKLYKRDKHGNYFAAPMNSWRGKTKAKKNKLKDLDQKLMTNDMQNKSTVKLWKDSLFMSIIIFVLFTVIYIIDFIIFLSGTHFITNTGYIFYSLFLLTLYLTYLILTIIGYRKKVRSLAIVCLILSTLVLLLTPLLYIGIGVTGWFALTQIIIYSKILNRQKVNKK